MFVSISTLLISLACIGPYVTLINYLLDCTWCMATSDLGIYILLYIYIHNIYIFIIHAWSIAPFDLRCRPGKLWRKQPL